MQNQENSSHHRYCVIPHSVRKRILKNPLFSNLFLTEIAYEDNTHFHPFTKGDAANHYLLVYVSRGEGSYNVLQKEYVVGENDFFVLPVKYAPTLRPSAENPWSIYWAYFSGSQASKVVSHLMGKGYAPRKAKPLVGRVAQFN